MSKKTTLTRRGISVDVHRCPPRWLCENELTDSDECASLDLNEQDDHNNQKLDYRKKGNA